MSCLSPVTALSPPVYYIIDKNRGNTLSSRGYLGGYHTPTRPHGISLSHQPHHIGTHYRRPPDTNNRSRSPIMSHTRPTAVSPSNFDRTFNSALEAYTKRTQNDLLSHPLTTQLEACDSPSTVLALLERQVQELNESRANGERWTRWLGPTVNVLYVFSETLSEDVSLVFFST